MRLSLFLLLAGLAAGPALAVDAPTAPTPEPVAVPTPEPAAAPAPPAAPVARNDGDVKVCRMVKEIGSNRATRVCKTKAQIEAESDLARKSMTGPQGDKSF